MKVKTSWLKEMRGGMGRLAYGGICYFRTDKYGNVVGLRSSTEPRAPSGKQELYRHQLRIWSLHWNFLTQSEKDVYTELGELAGMTGYDFFIWENYDKENLHMAPTDNRWVELWHPNTNPTAEEILHMSDDEEFEDWAYVNFPLEKISRNLVITKAELWLKYSGEAGWDAEGKRVDCHKIIEPWRETTITYNTRPDVSGTETDHTDMPAELEWFSFDVTADINSLISSAELFYGWRIKFHETVTEDESNSGLRSTYPHDDDNWPHLKLIL